MDEIKLQELLKRVQEEIDRVEPADEKGKALLEKTRADITALLSREKSTLPISRPGTTSRLEETIAHMEATHPDLTITLTELLNILSNAGI